YEHLIRAGAENLAQTGQAFEPSAATFATDGRVCAVPDTSRNLVIETSPLSYRLTDLALAAVDLAIERGYLAAGRWQIHLTGRDAPGIRLLDDTSPARLGILDWPAYRNLLATADLGLSLTASARPDYATNALAASGAFVVTNTWPGKPDLTTELNRVIMAVPNASALADAIGAAVARIEAEGQEPYTPQGTCLSPWPVVLYDVVEHLAKARGDV
ncbi:MAG: hypothetical protein FWD83_07265, partial [Promicromonosporaceae bacterium]|nr:hypothetical protein [Promicromonosporaceae bacterium]